MSALSDPLDRDPYHHVPAAFRQRCEAWRSSATNLVSGADSFRYMSIENLMFAERPLIEMETRLARPQSAPPIANEPWVIMECSTCSILWVFGLYEVTRGMRQAKHPKFPDLQELHRKLEVLRMPLAKHEVNKRRGKAHYPTSLWCTETGAVGWHVYDPAVDANVAFSRIELANEFLIQTGGLTPSSQDSGRG